MDRNTVFSRLDELIMQGRTDEVEEFLSEQYEMARENGDDNLALGILNEQIGFYRVTTQHEKALDVIARIISLLSSIKLEGTIEAGTSYLNIATAYRAMGKNKEAEEYYHKTEDIYRNTLEQSDYRMAGLYNNMSLMYQESGKYAEAVEYLQRALPIISRLEGTEIETAVTHTNLGQVYCKMKKWDMAAEELNLAEKIFESVNINDTHYSGCACAKGYLYTNLKDYDRAVEYYEKALLNVYELYGRNENFKSIQRDLREAYKLKGEPEYSSMMEVCRAYYERFGKPMLHEKFAEYEDRIAVGLCGEGSECLGVEDEISMDHDCGPGFAMWVTEQTYEEIGRTLQEAYEELPKVFAGYIRTDTAMGSGRCGVCRIDEFYKRVLGGQPIPEMDSDWYRIEETALATAVNGRVFTDFEGKFSTVREKLVAYYPHKIWIEKLARELMYAAQTGQYNYGRAMARGDYVTSSLALAEYMKSIMHVVFLLNRRYCPYYKWQHALVKKLEILPEVGYIMEAIADMPSQRDAWKDYVYNGNPNPNDMVAQTIEIVAKLVVNALHELKLSDNDNPYLEIQGQEVLKHMNDGNQLNREQLIDEVVKFEWSLFDMVKNKGGRADCQDDWNTFSIMRKSQYMTWTDDMLKEYLWHMDNSLKNGRNLITEKYGRMMESTAPLEYAEIKDAFPVLSEERRLITEEIIKIQVEWMEEFAREYPEMAGNARSIHTYEDTPYNTSYETYLRGELGTYSEELMKLYGQFIVRLSRENRNLAYMTMENTAKLYGYKSLEDAEKKMQMSK